MYHKARITIRNPQRSASQLVALAVQQALSRRELNVFFGAAYESNGDVVINIISEESGSAYEDGYEMARVWARIMRDALPAYESSEVTDW